MPPSIGRMAVVELLTEVEPAVTFAVSLAVSLSATVEAAGLAVADCDCRELDAVVNKGRIPAESLVVADAVPLLVTVSDSVAKTPVSEAVAADEKSESGKLRLIIGPSVVPVAEAACVRDAELLLPDDSGIELMPVLSMMVDKPTRIGPVEELKVSEADAVSL